MIRHPVLDQLSETGIKLGLDRVKSLLNALGEPHRAYPVVHVAGTNGKGSVCMAVTSALVEAGYRVGTNLSPHLEAVNERVRINGRPIDDARLNEAIEALHRARHDWAEGSNGGDRSVTYFEFMTIVAFLVFAQEAVDVAVVEVGMGGRLDATNVVQPQVCAITSIGFDHMEHLGDTLAAIAGEKAGIIKKNVPVVIGPLAQEARDAIEGRARQLGATVWRPGPDMMREQRKTGWSFRTPGGSLSDVRLALQGIHQGANALVALGVLHQLRRQGFLIPDEAIRAGFETIEFGGRIERIRPTLVLDGAHNEEGATALAAWLATQPRPKNRILLFGMGVDREPNKVLAPLLPHVDEVVFTRCNHPKSRDDVSLASALQDLDMVISAGGPIDEALPEVYAEADEVIVSGSLYLVGAARALVRDGVLDGITPGQGPVIDEEGEE